MARPVGWKWEANWEESFPVRPQLPSSGKALRGKEKRPPRAAFVRNETGNALAPYFTVSGINLRPEFGVDLPGKLLDAGPPHGD